MTYIESTWYFQQLARGLVPGGDALASGGRITDLDKADTPCDLWNGVNLGQPSHAWQTAAQTIDLVSDNAADNGVTPAAGLQSVLVLGLDANWTEIEEEVTLNGTTTVSTVAEFIRVNAIQGIQAGAYHGANQGLVTATYSVTGDAAAFMEPGIGRDYNAKWSTPKGRSAFILTPILSVSLNGWAEIVLRYYTNADQSIGPVYPGASRIGIPITASRAQALGLWIPIRIPEMADVWISVLTASDNNQNLSAVFDLAILNNET